MAMQCRLLTNLLLNGSRFQHKKLKNTLKGRHDDWLVTFIKGLFTCFDSHKSTFIILTDLRIMHVHYYSLPFREWMDIIQAIISSIFNVHINPHYFISIFRFSFNVINVGAWELSWDKMCFFYVLTFKQNCSCR